MLCRSLVIGTSDAITNFKIVGIMTKEYVRAIFTSDAWISTDRNRLRAICNDDWMFEEPILREILADYINNEDEMEGALKKLYENDQYRSGGFSICVESFALNELE